MFGKVGVGDAHRLANVVGGEPRRGLERFAREDMSDHHRGKDVARPVDRGVDPLVEIREDLVFGGVVTDDNISDVPVKWDNHGLEYNFGELLPIGSLSGYVYEDNNDNGVKDEGEAGIERVLVQLFVVGDDGIARFADSRLTDSEGYYEFESLEGNKTYVLRETQPTEYYDGKDAVGTIFGETVGALGENDEIVDIDLPHKGVGIHYDFGELKPGALSGYVYVDLNNNGLREPVKL